MTTRMWLLPLAMLVAGGAVVPDAHARFPGPDPVVTIGGDLRTWHKVTLDFEGPMATESDALNPFTEYRLEVTFTHPVTGAPWPKIPQMLFDLWDELADYSHPPEACLINYYTCWKQWSHESRWMRIRSQVQDRVRLGPLTLPRRSCGKPPSLDQRC